MEHIPYFRLVDYLDIQKGNILLVSSDMVLLGIECARNGYILDINVFIESLMNKLGREGTLLFPTYNWDFCKGITFDYYKTQCKTGILGQTALNRKDFRRTQHPIYSFAVWGKDQDYLCELSNKSAFGIDSPFAYLDKKKGKNLMVGLFFRGCFTYVHYIQEISGILDCRYMKNFEGKYIDEDQKESIREYSMFVKKLDLNVTNDTLPIGEHIENLGFAKRTYLNNVPITTVDLHSSSNIIMDDVKNNRSRKICKFIGQ